MEGAAIQPDRFDDAMRELHDALLQRAGHRRRMNLLVLEVVIGGHPLIGDASHHDSAVVHEALDAVLTAAKTFLVKMLTLVVGEDRIDVRCGDSACQLPDTWQVRVGVNLKNPLASVPAARLQHCGETDLRGCLVELVERRDALEAGDEVRMCRKCGASRMLIACSMPCLRRRSRQAYARRDRRGELDSCVHPRHDSLY